MTVIILLILAGGLVAGGFLGAFAWAVRTGQFDDVTTPAVRILLDDTNRLPDVTDPQTGQSLGRPRTPSPTTRG